MTEIRVDTAAFITVRAGVITNKTNKDPQGEDRCRSVLLRSETDECEYSIMHSQHRSRMHPRDHVIQLSTQRLGLTFPGQLALEYLSRHQRITF